MHTNMLSKVKSDRTTRTFYYQNIYLKSDKLAKTNFQYEKRQKELEKKKKKEEKLKRKLDKNAQPEENPDGPVPDGNNAQTDTP
jgi:hypothetical protein